MKAEQFKNKLEEKLHNYISDVSENIVKNIYTEMDNQINNNSFKIWKQGYVDIIIDIEEITILYNIMRILSEDGYKVERCEDYNSDDLEKEKIKITWKNDLPIIKIDKDYL